MASTSPTPAATPAEPPSALVVKNEHQLRLAEISEGLQILHPPGDLLPFEIRASFPSKGQKPFWNSGYFNNYAAASKAAFEMSHNGALGIYATYNCIDRDLFARSANTISSPSMTTDANVVRRRYLNFDVDPKRLSGIASTDEEQSLARQCAADIESWLCDTHGWPRPILGSTGNGYSLLFKIDEPNDDDTTACIKSILRAVGHAMSSHTGVDIDQAVCNAARMVRVFGTKNRKGSDTSQRPHRFSQLFEPPDPWGIVSTEQLKAIAALAPPEQAKVTATPPNTAALPKSPGSKLSRLMLDKWLFDCGATYTIKSKPGQTVYELDVCPFNQEHRNGKAAFYQQENGRPGFKCQSDKCPHNWHDAIHQHPFRIPEPHHYDPPLGVKRKQTAEPIALPPGTLVKALDRDNLGDVVADNGDEVIVHFRSPEGEEATKPFPRSQLRLADGTLLVEDPDREPITVISSADFFSTVYEHKYLIKGIFVENQPMICGGRSKTLKTSLLLDMAISLGTGTPFLGKFPTTKTTVGVISAESGEATLQESGRRICRARDVDPATAGVFWGFQLPQLTQPSDLDCMAEIILQNAIAVLMLDPIYLCMLAGDTVGLQTGNLFHVGPILLRLAQIAKRCNCTPILCHHFRKNSPSADKYGIPELEELSQAGCTEFARQWLLLGRRREYQIGTGHHELYVNAGGSAGHSGCYSVTVDEGEFVEGQDRKWDVDTQTLTEAKKEKKSAEEESTIRTEDEHRRKVLEVLRTFPDGECKSLIGDAAGVNPKNTTKALFNMKKRGEVNVEKVPGRKGAIWKLTEIGTDAI